MRAPENVLIPCSNTLSLGKTSSASTARACGFPNASTAFQPESIPPQRRLFFAARSKGRFAAVTAAAGAERHTIPQNRVTAFIQDDMPFITA